MKLIKSTLIAITTLFARAALAQAPEITSYFPQDGEDYRGYSITNVNTRLGSGYAAVGNHTVGGVNRSIHFMVMPGNGQGAIGSLLTFNHDDVRAVAINTLADGIVLLTLQIRDISSPSKIMVVTVNCSNPASSTVMSAETLGESFLNFYPLGATLDAQNKTYYVCGFGTPLVNNFPDEPDHTTPKYALMAKYDLGAGSGTYSIMNSPIDYTTPPANSNWNGLYNDYDLVQRLKFINGRLYAVGSSNGSAQTTWNFSTTQSVANSKIWIGLIDPLNMYPTQWNHFGKTQTTSLALPSFVDGYHGTDIIEDVNNPGAFYVTGQDVYWHTWTISSVQPNLQITPGLSWPLYANSLTYAYSADIKAHGAFTQNNDRISIYGTVSSYSPFPYSPDIANLSDGAVPFVTSFEPVWGSSGLTTNNLKWWIEGNRPNLATYLRSISSSYLMANSMSRYGIPVFATQYDAPNRKYELAMMGHIGDNSAVPKISPRFIFSDPDGEVNTCIASMEAPGTYPGVVGMALSDAAPFQLSGDGPRLTIGQDRVGIQPWRQSEYDCSMDTVYRQQPLAASQLSGLQATVVTLSPNPASDKLTVNFGIVLNGKELVSITLTDVTGRKVLRLDNGVATGTGVSFALPSLAHGLYTCSIGVNDKIISLQKLAVE